ncbi:MAG: autotransporter outer membrane beta-barrel domain-containing protein [Candidatus Zixiibacteriota bacterium]
MSRVKSLIVATALLLVLAVSGVWADAYSGGAFGNLTTARTVGMGKGFWAVGVGVADATSFFGSFTYGMSNSFDGRVKFGFVDRFDDTEVSIGFDVKYQMLVHGGASNNPFDMALGGLFEHVDYGNASVMQIGFLATGSYPFAMSNGRALSPYVRANVRIEDKNHDLRTDRDTSDLELGLNAGVHYELSKNVGLYGEFQIDGNDGLFFGLDFNVL